MANRRFTEHAANYYLWIITILRFVLAHTTKVHDECKHVEQISERALTEIHTMMQQD